MKDLPIIVDEDVVEAVEAEAGMGSGAWDCVDPQEIIRAVVKVLLS